METVTQILKELTILTAVCTALGISIIAIIFLCTNPNKIPLCFRQRFDRVRDSLSCYKNHPSPEDEMELDLLPPSPSQ